MDQAGMAVLPLPRPLSRDVEEGEMKKAEWIIEARRLKLRLEAREKAMTLAVNALSLLVPNGRDNWHHAHAAYQILMEELRK